MNSPVERLISQFIHLDKSKPAHLYLQIVDQVIQAIQKGVLLVDDKLPGSRVLSTVLGVHRKTIIAALEELQAQGWLEAKPNVGTFVKNPVVKQKQLSGNNAANEDHLIRANFGFKKSFFLDTPFEESFCELVFNDGLPDIRLTKLEELSRSYSTSLKRKQVSKKMNDFSFRGNKYFVEQLSYYLNVSRGLRLSPQNLSITKSVEMCLFALTHLLVERKEIVLVCEWSSFAANMIFQQGGAVVKTIPIDNQGVDVSFIREHFIKGEIRFLYLSSQHHYPTTITMSSQRRNALLELADEYDFVIIEDDYDYEFHFEKTQVLPIASSDYKGRVIYIGAFGKSLNPAFQIGFICGPKDMIHAANKFLALLDPNGDVVMEQALAEMIESGEIFRSLKKALKIYRERRDFFATLLDEHFQEDIEFNIPSGGLAFWIVWKKKFSLMQLAIKCKEHQLFLPRICLYQNQSITAVRLGFGHLSTEEMMHSVKILQKCYQLVLKENEQISLS